MPQFYFHTNGERDADGVELASLAVAKCEAVKLAAQIVCEQAGEFWDEAEWSMTVTDENDLTMFQLQVIGTEAPAIRASSSRRSA
jgi:hypothetical protein